MENETDPEAGGALVQRVIFELDAEFVVLQRDAALLTRFPRQTGLK